MPDSPGMKFPTIVALTAKDVKDLRQNPGYSNVDIFTYEEMIYENVRPGYKSTTVAVKELNPDGFQGDREWLLNYDTSFGDQQLDSQNMDLFISLRSLCARKQIQCETVVLEDSDVAKALIGYVNEYEIDTLFVGAVSKTGISRYRLFKGTDTPSTILKSAPDFCNVYIISKRKVAAARPASRPVPSRAQGLNNQEASDIDDDGDGLFCDDEVVALDDINSSLGEAAAGTNNAPFVYGSLGSTLRSPTVLDPFRRSDVRPVGTAGLASFHIGPKHRSNPSTLRDYSSSMLDSGDSSEEEFAAENNDETRRLRIELKQTMDMYHAACKEALRVKRQMMQLQEWKRKQENRMRLEEQATPSVDEATQKLMEKEVQKRVDAGIQKALSEAEERRRKLLDDLGQPQCQLGVKYQSLFHILAVIFLFYFYFTIQVIGGSIKEKEYG